MHEDEPWNDLHAVLPGMAAASASASTANQLALPNNSMSKNSEKDDWLDIPAEFTKKKILRQSRVNPMLESSHPRVGGFFSNTFGFSSGFVNASFGDASPNSSICSTNITRVISFGTSLWGQLSDPTKENLYEATNSVENVLASAHPITFSCYHSVSEFGKTTDYYMETLSNF